MTESCTKFTNKVILDTRQYTLIVYCYARIHVARNVANVLLIIVISVPTRQHTVLNKKPTQFKTLHFYLAVPFTLSDNVDAYGYRIFQY